MRMVCIACDSQRLDAKNRFCLGKGNGFWRGQPATLRRAPVVLQIWTGKKPGRRGAGTGDGQ